MIKRGECPKSNFYWIENLIQTFQKMNKNLYLGVDIGSVSVKVVLLSPDGEILRSYYQRSNGQPLPTLKSILENLFGQFNPADIKSLATTGTGGKLINSILGGSFVNEVSAQV